MLTWANLKRFWKEHLVHVALAGTAGFFVADFAPWLWALCIFALIVARQVMEWANSAPHTDNNGQRTRVKVDTPGIDFGYFQIGNVLGGVVAMLDLVVHLQNAI